MVCSLPKLLHALLLPSIGLSKWLFFGFRGHQIQNSTEVRMLFQLSKSLEFGLRLSYRLTEYVSLVAGRSCLWSRMCSLLV